MYDFQKANMWKRLSAALFDIIILGIVAVGAALLLSLVLGYDTHSDRFAAITEKYEAEYGLDFDITAEEYEALSEEEKKAYEAANEAYGKDPEVRSVYGMIVSLSLTITTFAILLAYLVLEFLIPLLLGNGQTLGKKIFGVGVMREDGVKLTPLLLFARTVLGKYTVGTMIPVFVIIMVYFNMLSIFGVVVIGALLLIQGILFFGTTAHTPIHDKLAHTVTVDIASQMIFASPEALLEYKKRIHAEEAETRER